MQGLPFGVFLLLLLKLLLLLFMLLLLLLLSCCCCCCVVCCVLLLLFCVLSLIKDKRHKPPNTQLTTVDWTIYLFTTVESQKLVSIIPVLTCGACQIEGCNDSQCWISPTYRHLFRNGRTVLDCPEIEKKLLFLHVLCMDVLAGSVRIPRKPFFYKEIERISKKWNGHVPHCWLEY